MVALARMRVDPGDVQAHKAAAVTPCRDVLLEICNHLVASQAPEQSPGTAGGRAAGGVKGGVDLGVHTVQAAFDRHPEWARNRGDSLGPLHLAAPLQTVLERVQEGQPEVIVLAYLDDVLLVGTLLATAYDAYADGGGRDWPSHSACKVSGLLAEADTGFLAEEMPGARGELDFINILGEPVGKPEVVTGGDAEEGGGDAWHFAYAE
ncbi:hypothetical protein CYMTET_18309 [Cymbomonas tetramitiformis]|uniref:Uncharacterized protein n=1 Tax=Cymbomonas tetramitiformis TaxID=36881 RepID=A0AAE0G8S6_9CHLO|nr:hypothetical protein CYMTET_18309 [Cymbomonas tetramitiformis]